MSNTNYTFAVAYIRALETNLFSDSMMSQLAACKTYEECVRFLQDKGWGNGQGGPAGSENNCFWQQRRQKCAGGV